MIIGGKNGEVIGQPNPKVEKNDKTGNCYILGHLMPSVHCPKLGEFLYWYQSYN